MPNDFFGLLGLGLIILAWLPGVLETLQSKKPGMKKRFMLLYFLGSASLATYAWQLQAFPFLMLNSLAALVPITHFYFYIKKHGIGKIFTPSNKL